MTFLGRALLSSQDEQARVARLTSGPLPQPAERRMFAGRVYRFGGPTGLIPIVPQPTLSPACKLALAADQRTVDGVKRALAAWPILTRAATANREDPRALGAIGLHESNFVADKKQPDGMGRGAMQIDLGKHPDVTEQQAEYLPYAANFTAAELRHNMGVLAARFPQFTPEQLLHATITSHNLGVGKKENFSGNPDTIDQGTTGGNYGRRVLDLMQCFPPPR